MTTLRKVPDDLWEELEQELPAPPSRAKGGRKRVEDRKLLDAMLDVLWTGCPWRALSRHDVGPWQTVYARFGEWRTAGICERGGARGLQLDDQQQGIDWQGQAAEGTSVRAPRGGKRGRPQSH